jgi:hypothetical protein
VKPAAGEPAHLGQLAAVLALRDRGEEADRHVRLRQRGLDQRAEHRRRVDDGLGVRHREDRAVPARRRGRGAGGDRLLVFAARRAQVDVGVDERGCEQEPGALDDAVAVRVDAARDLRDDAVVDAHVEQVVDPLHRVDDARAADDEVLARRVLRVEHQATSSLTAAGTATGPCVSRS